MTRVDEGDWIFLYRDLLDHWSSDEPCYLSVWIHLLLLANHSDQKKLINGNPVTIRRGQVMTSRKSLSRKTGVQQSKLERILRRFKSDQQIEQESFSKYRVISIINWPKYQGGEQENDQQMNSKRTADEQQVNTLKECNKEIRKEIKEKNTKKEVQIPDFIPSDAWNDYAQFRKSSRKGWTQLIQKKTIERLTELHKEGQNIKNVIDQTIISGWSSLHPVKNQNQQSSALDNRRKELHGQRTEYGTDRRAEGLRDKLSVLDIKTRKRITY